MKTQFSWINKHGIHLIYGIFLKRGIYRKFAIDRPGGKQFLASHGIIIQIYFDRKTCILLEYNCIIVLRCVVQKLCVAKNCLPPGLSIANLRYNGSATHTFPCILRKLI